MDNKEYNIKYLVKTTVEYRRIINDIRKNEGGRVQDITKKALQVGLKQLASNKNFEQRLIEVEKNIQEIKVKLKK